MKNILSFDFSIAKPAACLLLNEVYHYYSWPKDLSEKNKKIFKNAGINIIDRPEKEIYKDNMQTEIKNASILSDLILQTLNPFLKDISHVAFEGLSYGSKGNVMLSLAGWRFIFQSQLAKFIPIENMFTYPPTTIKKTAGCSKKGMGKSDMINAFASGKSDFSEFLNNNKEKFQTKSGNWITHLDDIVDSYWCVETLIIKQLI